MPQRILLGDEAVALGAVHAGLTAAYSYPGTPATEIMESLQAHRAAHGGPHATWCANEKTAFEGALGVSFAGRRALVSMKHVGLNVAADPFMNSALVEVHGGLVLAVADDPGMHSSQNEQDSRYYADFARVVCLEPANQQEAYDMTLEAFDLSERFRIPVMVRLVTRLAHGRTVVDVGEPREQNPIRRAPQRTSWILLPGNARRQWRSLLERQREFAAHSEGSRWNTLELNPADRSLGVITCGIARGYFRENAAELAAAPSHLHIGAYPAPVEAIRRLAATRRARAGARGRVSVHRAPAARAAAPVARGARPHGRHAAARRRAHARERARRTRAAGPRARPACPGSRSRCARPSCARAARTAPCTTRSIAPWRASTRRW